MGSPSQAVSRQARFLLEGKAWRMPGARAPAHSGRLPRTGHPGMRASPNAKERADCWAGDSSGLRWPVGEATGLFWRPGVLRTEWTSGAPGESLWLSRSCAALPPAPLPQDTRLSRFPVPHFALSITNRPKNSKTVGFLGFVLRVRLFAPPAKWRRLPLSLAACGSSAYSSVYPATPSWSCPHVPAPGPVRSTSNTGGNTAWSLLSRDSHVIRDNRLLTSSQSRGAGTVPGNQRECPSGAGGVRGKGHSSRVLQNEQEFSKQTRRGRASQKREQCAQGQTRQSTVSQLSLGIHVPTIPRFKTLLNKPDANQTIIHLLA